MNYGLGNTMMDGSARDGSPQMFRGADPLAMDKILGQLSSTNAQQQSPLQQMIARMNQPQQKQQDGGPMKDIAQIAQIAALALAFV